MPHSHLIQGQAYVVPDPLPEDAVCGCMLQPDGTLAQPVCCLHCAGAYNARACCPNCYGSGMIMIGCTHRAVQRTVVSRPSANPGTPGHSSRHGGSGGDGGSGSARSRRTTTDRGHPTPVRSSRHS